MDHDWVTENGLTQEDPSQHNRKIVDWDVKKSNQTKDITTNQTLCIIDMIINPYKPPVFFLSGISNSCYQDLTPQNAASYQGLQSVFKE